MTLTTPGIRVIRGPDWEGGEIDGGEGGVGTITECPKSSSQMGSAVNVRWDNGKQSQCRIGYLSAYDLRIVDNGPSGIRHPLKKCRFCGDSEEGITGIAWVCSSCAGEVSLCTLHYMNDKHDTSHSFLRLEIPTSSASLVPPRKGSRKAHLRGVFKGAKVQRSADWMWQDQDGGLGKTGKVLEIQDWDKNSIRSVANVAWTATGITNIYRIGHKGKVDVQCTQMANGGNCYIDHLPVIGKEQSLVVSLPQSINEPMPSKSRHFKLGEKVCISVRCPNQLEQLQENHGGFNPKMLEFIDLVGEVHRMTSSGDCRIQYPGDPPSAHRWTVNPAALTSIQFSVGQNVKLIKDMEIMRKLQNGHGGWSEAMSEAINKVGRVVKIYPEYDLRVNFMDKEWTFNPVCLRAASASEHPEQHPLHPEILIQDRIEAKQREDSFIGSCAAGDFQSVRSLLQDDYLLRLITPHVIRSSLHEACLNGHLDIVMFLVDRHPDFVFGQVDGKNTLQVASHRGHLHIVKYLLSDPRRKALIDARDHEGDTALHYAAYGRATHVVEYLLAMGADPNATNEKKCSVLHVSVLVDDIDTARLLLAQPQINVNARDAFEDTPLHEAIVKDCPEMIGLLCLHPTIDFNAVNKRGFNCMHYSALKGSISAIQKINGATHGSMINVRKDDGFTPLHLSSLNGHARVVNYLLGIAHLDLLAVDHRGRNCLHCAVHQGHSIVMELIIAAAERRGEKSSLINSCDAEGDTPLHIALRREGEPSGQGSWHTEEDEQSGFQGAKARVVSCGLVPKVFLHAVSVAAFLMSHGAKVTVRNKAGYLPRDLVMDPNIRLYLSQLEQKQTVQVSNSPAAPPPLHDKKSLKCIICCETMKGDLTAIRFEPCGHIIACVKCCTRMKKCLQCQSRIERKFPVQANQKPGNDEEDGTEDEEVKSLRTMKLDDLEKKVQDMELHYFCSICMERKKNVAFLCGHGTCEYCWETLSCCHMCRGPVTEKISLY